MAKIVKTVVMVAIAVAIIVYAAPIAGALAGLGAGVASAATIAAVTSAVVGVGISLGLSAAMSVFRKSASLPQASAERLNQSVIPSAARKIVFGRTAAGNDIRFFETWGAKSDQYAQVIALASHKINAVLQWYVEEDLTWSGSLVKHADGITVFRAITEGSSSNAQAMGSGLWNTSSKFTGCAYLAINYKLDNKPWPSGIPTKTTTIVEGCPLYDPRLDSTNGGSGSHRIADQNSWQYRTAGGIEIGRNPALALLVYMIGWRINGKLVWGMGIPSSRINFDNFRTYANVCEERVLLLDGTSVQRYTADGITSTAESHETTIAALTAAMGSCKLTDTGGLYGIVGGYDDTLGPKQAFDAGDLMGGAGSPTPYVWTPSGPARETYNIVRGRFADPASQYQLVDWGVVETDPLADGVPRTLSLDLGFVSRAETCQRIAKQFVARESLTPGTFSATFGPKAFAVQVGSLITMSLPSKGWNAKLFRVQDQKEVHDMFYQMTLREEAPEIYAWDKEEKPLPANIRPTGFDASMTITPAGLVLNSTTYEGVS